MDDLLIITNGTSAEAAIREAGVEAHFCPWNDPLHDGPVPGGLTAMALSRVRARYIADLGWGEHEDILRWFDERDARIDAAPNFREVMLWFEHDLYDQLQLIQVLHRLRSIRAHVTLLQADTYIGYSSKSALRHAFDLRRRVTAEHFETASLAWEAFTAPDPRPAQALVSRYSTAPMPFLAGAFKRWFQTFPDPVSGLGRTERSVLSRVRAGLSSPIDLFRATSDEEEAMFRGDASFFELVRRMTAEREPLLATETGDSFDVDRVAETRLRLTSAGLSVLAGESDRIVLSGIDDWRGGIRLTTERNWRWSSEGGFEERVR